MATVTSTSLSKPQDDAALGELPLVSVEEYLRTGYTPDVEYLEGRLREKSVVGFPHGQLQVLLGTWFQNHAREWGIKVAVETRTRVKPGRFRLPDLVIVPSALKAPSVLETPPLIAIEILSPSDEYAELRARARDLEEMGCAHIWLIDPEEKTAAIWAEGSWHLFAGERLEATGTGVSLDLHWLWTEFA